MNPMTIHMCQLWGQYNELMMCLGHATKRAVAYRLIAAMEKLYLVQLHMMFLLVLANNDHIDVVQAVDIDGLRVACFLVPRFYMCWTAEHCIVKAPPKHHREQCDSTRNHHPAHHPPPRIGPP